MHIEYAYNIIIVIAREVANEKDERGETVKKQRYCTLFTVIVSAYSIVCVIQ